ncbi:MAG: DEAD/DEAH box helicase [bacterium]
MSEENKKEIYDFGFKLDEFQVDAIDHIKNGNSVVVCAPTGAGKTVIAQAAIRKALSEGRRAFYTTPLKALSNQKFNDFKQEFGEERTGLLTGDTSINRDADVVVMTTEVFRNMLYGTKIGSIEENLNNVQSVILDEVHYMNDEQRGTVWEESIIYCPNHFQIIALSATVANAAELTDWINTVHGQTYLVNSDFRPVPLRFHYYSPSIPDKLYGLLTPDGNINSKIKPENPQLKKNIIKKVKTKDETVPNLVRILHEKEMLPAIYFTFSRKRCDLNAKDCSKLKLLSDFEQKRLNHIIDEYILDNPYLSKHKNLEYLYAGIASHHAGLLPVWKSLIERLFQQGLIKVVFATETLAAGINMPARSTIISSITKRTDDGHRVLTASEFLQMSGRAGRRGMDDVGYVTVVGSAFQHPEEVANLARSAAEPLESRFTPSYSMVLNLLQRFNIDQTRELILKSFGYYSSTERLKPLYNEQEIILDKIKDINSLVCPHSLKHEDVQRYNKLKNTYIQYKKIANTLRRQAKAAGKKNTSEVREYEGKAKDFLAKSERIKCSKCKFYAKHIKSLDILERFNKRYEKLKVSIDFEKDIYWRQFLNLVGVMNEMGYLNDNFPTSLGLTAAASRTENELFFTEIIMSGMLEYMSPSELAGFVSAISTEESRNQFWYKLQPSDKVRESVFEAKNIMKLLSKMQKKYDVNTIINLNPAYSAFLEFWVEGGDWDEMLKGVDLDEGDIVRAFKRSVDLLRQLTVIPGVSKNVADTASKAISMINRDPITDIF